MVFLSYVFLEKHFPAPLPCAGEITKCAPLCKQNLHSAEFLPERTNAPARTGSRPEPGAPAVLARLP
jgi:hypothetical protein